MSWSDSGRPRAPSALPDGATLAQKSIDTLRRILVHHIPAHDIACVFVGGAELHMFLTIKHCLAVADGRGALAHNLTGLAVDGSIHLPIRNSLIDEAPVSRGR